MNISQVGINLIKSFEGCSLKAYKVAGANEKYWTIGYGHYGADVGEHQTITAKQAEDLLKKDLQHYVDGVNECLKVPVTQNQFDSLVSFSYNCGVGALQKSTMLVLINKKDFVDAAKEFDKYVHAGGNVLKGLVTRRNAEQALFLKDLEVPKPKVKAPVRKAVVYVVKKGDSLSKIALNHSTTVVKLQTDNHIKDASLIYPGQKITIK